jgi:hypothetical protein
MTTLIYSAIAIAFLILVTCLHLKSQRHDPGEPFTESSYAPKIGNGRWLDLSERIFDPSDARWLAEDLAFPALAKDLIVARKRLAIRWLRSLQVAFDDIVRTPEISAPASPADSWQLLWLTLRFKFLISYALVVVKWFGPYHRLIPSFAWVPFAREENARQATLAESPSSR